MIKTIKLAIIACFICGTLSSTAVKAAMVQSLKQATSYDIFLPKDRKRISDRYDGKANPSINYNPAIARKLFNMSDGQKRTITIEEGINRAHVALGSKIRVILENVENAKWYMECSDEIVLINTQHKNGNIIMLFDTLSKGRANILFDCVDNSDNGFNVIASKYINIVVD